MAADYTLDIQLRSRDMDELGHFNHTVYVVYMQQARHEYLDDEIPGRREGPAPVVAHLDIDYEREIRRGQTVTVAVEPTGIGETSFGLGYEIRADGGVAATGESVQVTVDRETRQPRPVPDAWVEAMGRTDGTR